MPCRSALLVLLAVPFLATEVSGTAQSAWMTDPQAAFARAEARQQLLLVDLYADWCSWCKVLDREVFSSEGFRELAADFVLLRVDVEDGAEGAALRDRFAATELPTLLILTPRNSLAGSVVGYYETAAYLEILRGEVDRYRQFESRFEEQVKSDDPTVLQKLGMSLHARADAARAQRIWERLLERSDVPPPDRRWLEYLVADALRLQGRFEEAATRLAELREEARKAQDAQLLPQLERLALRLGRDQSGCRSVAALERFLAEYPRSRHRGQALHLLAVRRDATGTCGDAPPRDGIEPTPRRPT